MKYISEREYSARLKRIEADNYQHELRQKLKAENTVGGITYDMTLKTMIPPLLGETM